jgi:SpoVK/Ycf46/Vps4 family AAA+-type ATPase
MDSNAELTLEYFLNLLQGSLTRDGTIFIATTNHLEVIDPAFYRVGRFDIKINMKKCDSHQIKTIFSKFVGRDIDKNILDKIEIDIFTPAEVIFHLINFIDSELPDSEIMSNFM